MKLTLETTREQANVNHRAQRLFEDGYRLTVISESTKTGKVYEITSPEGNAYRVDTCLETCDCPYFVKRNPQLEDDPFAERLYCKHYIGAEKLRLECEAEEAGMDVDTYFRWKTTNEARDEGYIF